MQNKKLEPGHIVLLVSGAVALVASFLPWFDTPFGDFSSWSTDANLFPIATFVPLSAIAAAAIFALGHFADTTIDDGLIGLGGDHLRRAFAYFGTVLAIGWLIAADDLGLGFFLSTLACIGAVVGSVMMDQAAKAPEPVQPYQQPPPPQAPPPQAPPPQAPPPQAPPPQAPPPQAPPPQAAPAAPAPPPQTTPPPPPQAPPASQPAPPPPAQPTPPPHQTPEEPTEAAPPPSPQPQPPTSPADDDDATRPGSPPPPPPPS